MKMNKVFLIAFWLLLCVDCYGQYDMHVINIYIVNRDKFEFSKFYDQLSNSIIISDKLIFQFSNASNHTKIVYIVKEKGNDRYFMKYYETFKLSLKLDSVIEYSTVQLSEIQSRRINKYVKYNKYTIKNIKTSKYGGNWINDDEMYWYFAINSIEFNYTLRMTRFPYSNHVNSGYFRQFIYRMKVKKFMKMIYFPF